MNTDELQKLVDQRLIAFKDGTVPYPVALLALLRERVELETEGDRRIRHWYPR